MAIRNYIKRDSESFISVADCFIKEPEAYRKEAFVEMLKKAKRQIIALHEEAEYQDNCKNPEEADHGLKWPES